MGWDNIARGKTAKLSQPRVATAKDLAL